MEKKLKCVEIYWPELPRIYYINRFFLSATANYIKLYKSKEED